MRKLLSKLAVLATAICLILCCGVIAACGDDNDDGKNPPPAETTYNVTVQLENGTPVKDVALKFCTLDENGEELNCQNTTKTDADGKVSITLKTENYHVDVITKGYEVVGEVTTATAGNTFTVTVKTKA